jgi:hypothetical protein
MCTENSDADVVVMKSTEESKSQARICAARDALQHSLADVTSRSLPKARQERKILSLFFRRLKWEEENLTCAMLAL